MVVLRRVRAEPPMHFFQCRGPVRRLDGVDESTRDKLSLAVFVDSDAARCKPSIDAWHLQTTTTLLLSLLQHCATTLEVGGRE